MSQKKKRFGLDATQATALLGVIAAIAIAVIANVLAARRNTRWDWTTARRYSLSAATTITLRDLREPVDVWVLMGGADPLVQSVKQLLKTGTSLLSWTKLLPFS